MEKFFKMDYNTQRKKLPLPEYGRNIQHMVDYLFTIEDRDGTEKIVRTDASTTLREARTTKPVTELREGDMVVIIGTPNDEGEVLAKLIRLMPPLPEGGAMNFPMMKSSDVTR